MVRAFNLWNFYQNADGTFNFEATEANFPGIKDGSEEWVRDCLAAFGIKAKIQHWEIKPCRSFYYTDYPDGQNWEDRWPYCWSIKVYPEENILKHTNTLFFVPAGVDSADSTWTYDYKNPNHNTSALFIADFQLRGSEVEILFTEGLQELQIPKFQTGYLNYAIRSYQDALHQLRIMFSEISFPEVIPDLDRLLQYFEMHNGAVNWRDRLTWQADA